MTRSEFGFLLLCCDAGDGCKPLSLYQLELLRRRMTAQDAAVLPDADITPELLKKLGYSEASAMQLSQLLSREDALQAYLALGKEQDCLPLTCVSPEFPQTLRPRLGRRCPAVLFYRGNLSLLKNRCISLAGARQLKEPGHRFAQQVGELAAAEGFTLVSGNAKGADKAAQDACLACGGSVIAVLSEPLNCHCPENDRILYLAESGWHQEFSAARALSRNRLIYALGEKCFIAQCAVGSGTWQGAEDALKHGTTVVCVNNDGSDGCLGLLDLGAFPVNCGELTTLTVDYVLQASIFDSTFQK